MVDLGCDCDCDCDCEGDSDGNQKWPVQHQTGGDVRRDNLIRHLVIDEKRIERYYLILIP